MYMSASKKKQRSTSHCTLTVDPRLSLRLVGVAMLVWCLAIHPAGAQSMVFEGARVIPGDGGLPIENASIVVEGGKIARIGAADRIVVPQGAIRIELAGKTVMPAIISTHVHPGFQRGASYAAENYSRETILDDMTRELYFGISTAQSLGIEKGDTMLQIRADQAAGKVGGARLLVAGRGIGAPNAGPGLPVYANIAYAITTENEARKAVQEQAQRRVDIIKIWVDDRDGRAKELPINLSRLIISEGHEAGLKVIAHEFYHKDADELAAAGIDAFAHLVRDKVMSDALIETMREKGIYVMPNLGYPEFSGYTTPPAWLDEPYLAGLLRDVEPADAIAHLRKSFSEVDPAVAKDNRQKYEILKASVAKLTAAGARIILGSDTGLPDQFFGFTEQRELQLMVEAGMTPADVIVAATSRAAEFLGTTDRGSLVPGKRADFLVLDANPLDDIRNTRRIAKMYLSGVEVDRAAIRQSLRCAGRGQYESLSRGEAGANVVCERDK
jgi:imidazolonepropionase-like amidohydrolase